MNMEELRKYQLAQLELLDVTSEVCKNLNLTYYLIGGTLLGAVRHKGFIPWDADIDIAMPRRDYEAFLNYWNTNPSERYCYQHYTTEKNHLSPHAVLRIKNTRVVMCERLSRYTPGCEGIYMDIFPLDNPPESSELQKKQAEKIARFKRIIELKAGYQYSSTTRYKAIAKRLVQIILSPFSLQYLNQKLDACMKQYSTGDGQYLVSMASHYSYRKQLMPREIYGIPTPICFEDKVFNAPENTHEYLTRIYKDYMKLPSDTNLYTILDQIETVDYGITEEE